MSFVSDAVHGTPFGRAAFTAWGNTHGLPSIGVGPTRPMHEMVGAFQRLRLGMLGRGPLVDFHALLPAEEVGPDGILAQRFQAATREDAPNEARAAYYESVLDRMLVGARLLEDSPGEEARNDSELAYLRGALQTVENWETRSPIQKAADIDYMIHAAQKLRPSDRDIFHYFAWVVFEELAADGIKKGLIAASAQPEKIDLTLAALGQIRDRLRAEFTQDEGAVIGEMTAKMESAAATVRPDADLAAENAERIGRHWKEMGLRQRLEELDWVSRRCSIPITPDYERGWHALLDLVRRVILYSIEMVADPRVMAGEVRETILLPARRIVEHFAPADGRRDALIASIDALLGGERNDPLLGGVIRGLHEIARGLA